MPTLRNSFLSVVYDYLYYVYISSCKMTENGVIMMQERCMSSANCMTLAIGTTEQVGPRRVCVCVIGVGWVSIVTSSLRFHSNTV